MLLSVVIPVYNCEKYIEEAVLSIEKQPCKDVEILIVDDGSKDNSGNIADNLAEKFTNIKVFHIPNGGVSHARNYGVSKSIGKYISFLDADDVWCKNVYTDETQQLLLSSDRIISFGYISCDEKLTMGNFIEAKNYEPKFNSHFNNFYYKSFCSNMYPKNIFEKINFDERHTYGEDMEFLMKIWCENIPIISLDSPLFMYRHNKNSVMHSQNRSDSKYLLTQIKVFNDLYNYAVEQGYSQEHINGCTFMLLTVALSYIEESTIKGKKQNEIVFELSSLIDLAFLRTTEVPWKDDSLSYIQQYFFNNYTQYKKNTIIKNLKRYIANKLKLNQIEIIRSKILSPKYQNNVLDYHY